MAVMISESNYPTRIWKIMNKKTGMFWSGGRWGRWTSTGRIWQRIGDVKNSLNYMESYSKNEIKYVQVVHMSIISWFPVELDNAK